MTIFGLDPDEAVCLRTAWKQLEESVALPGIADVEDDSWKQFEKYRDDPVGFVTACWPNIEGGCPAWAFQRGFLEDVRDFQHVSVRAGRKVGKTHSLGWLVCWWMSTRPAIVLTFGAGERSLKGQLWGEIGELHRTSRLPLPGKPDQLQWNLSPRHYAMAIVSSASGQGDSGAVGFHAGAIMPFDPDKDLTPEQIVELHKKARDLGAGAPELLAIFDECQRIRQPVLRAMAGSIQGPGARRVYTGNPLLSLDSDHDFAVSHRPSSKQWRKIKVAAEPSDDDLPADRVFTHVPTTLVSTAWIEEQRREMTEDDPRFWSDVWARFSPDSSDMLFVPQRLIVACEALDIEGAESVMGLQLGVDISRKGKDWCVATLLNNLVLVAQHKWKSDDTMASADIIVLLARQWGMGDKPIPARNIHVDDCGIGGGVVDRLVQVGMRVDAVDVGAAAQDDWGPLVHETKFANRKAELLWATRRLMQERRLSIPPRFSETRQQLQWHSYKFLERVGGTVVAMGESKDEIVDRYGVSPDFADSLVLAISRTGNAPKIHGSVTHAQIRKMRRAF